LNLFWSNAASEDRMRIIEHIANDNITAAIQMDVLFEAAAERLTEHPRMGKPGRVSGTRELLPHDNYRLTYEVHDDAIWVLSLIHVARLPHH
jgi:toxin ParE1/3/4